jgi:hypothetical protein
MNANLTNFIKDMCNKECGEYFEISKESCFIQIKERLSSNMLFQRNLNQKLQIKVARVASPIIRNNNQIDKNRFWILYYRLAEKLIISKCDQANLSTTDNMMCKEYILNRLINQIKTFNINTESIPFQEVRANLNEIAKIYYTSNNFFLDIDPLKLQYTNGVVKNYTNKILKRYSKDSVDIYSIEAIIENALLNIGVDNSKTYQKKGEKGYIEKEISIYLNHNKNEMEIILYPILLELLHQEKFFNYINNYFINNRFIDFTRTLKNVPAIPIKKDDNPEPLSIEEILKDYLELIPLETLLILRLKIGERLNNREFIKLVYNFDYKQIDILSHFDDEEVLEIKFYVRNNIDISKETNKKISKIREKLKANSYINREDDAKRVVLLKLIFSEEMNAKEIGLFLGYRDKQIYKKIESIKNKINNKKRLELCKEM